MKNIFNFLLILIFSANALFAQKPYVEYWHNAKKATEGTLSNEDIRIGTWRWFYEDGALQKIGEYNDKGVKIGEWVDYYANGKVKKQEFLSGKGECKAFYENGQLQYIYNVVDGLKQGEYIEYYDDGKRKIQANYKDNELDGYAIWFFPDGNKDMEGGLKMGKRDGNWIYYYRSNGQKGSEGAYLNDKETGRWIYYYETSEKWREGDYRNGLREGLWNTYYENGKIHHKGSYIAGKEEGIWESYFENGELNIRGRFIDGKMYLAERLVTFTETLAFVIFPHESFDNTVARNIFLRRGVHCRHPFTHHTEVIPHATAIQRDKHHGQRNDRKQYQGQFPTVTKEQHKSRQQ